MPLTRPKTRARAHAAPSTPAQRALAFDSVKVFSATMVRDRAQLGELVTAWLGENHEIDLVEIVVKQSSDARFHCVSVVVFYRAATGSRCGQDADAAE